MAERPEGRAQGGGVVIYDHDTLASALDRRLDDSGRTWVADTSQRVSENPGVIATVFPAVGRSVGRGALEADATAGDVHAWTLDDAARVLLLVALGTNVESQIQLLYRHGDGAERRGVLRALPFIELDRATGLALVDDAMRTNDVGLIAAAMGPYAAEHLDNAAYAQGVLKCVFVGVPLGGVPGTHERDTPGLAAMLGRYVHERIAAGRSVPADVWPLIDLYPPARELAEIQAELDNPNADRRDAAQAALAARHHARTDNH
jgi:hypothetical protein